MSGVVADRETTSDRETSGGPRGIPVAAVTAAAAVLVALAVLVVVVAFGGAYPDPVPGLPDAGPLTAWALPVAKLAVTASGVLTVGLLLTAAVLVPDDSAGDSAASHPGALPPAGRRCLTLASWCAGAWGAAALVLAAFTWSDLLALPVTRVLGLSSLIDFLTSINQGRALLVVMSLAGCVFLGARRATTGNGAAVLLLVAVAAVLPPTLTGHAAASSNHDLSVTAMAVHAVAAAVWVGGLAGVVVCGHLLDHGLDLVVARFSRIALVCFLAVLASGVVSAAVRLETPEALLTSRYGLLVLAKADALALLAACGWAHRRRTIPALATSGAPGRGTPFVRLAGVELVLMAAAVALAAGMSRTPTPAGSKISLADLAQELLGYPLPGPLTVRALLLGWQAEPLFVLLIALGAVGYLVGVLRLRRSGTAWPAGRTAAWYAGLVVVAVATCGGVGRYAPVLFSVHVGQHMLLVTLAPALLLAGAPATLALRALRPLPAEAGRGPRELLLAASRSPAVHLAAHPAVGFAAYAASLYGLYFTPAFGWAISSQIGHVAMMLCVLAAGLLYLRPIVAAGPVPGRLSYPARVLLLAAGLPVLAFFGVALRASTTVIAADWYRALRRPWGPTPLADQHAAGVVAWVAAGIPLLLVLILLAVQWSRRGGKGSAPNQASRALPSPEPAPGEQP